MMSASLFLAFLMYATMLWTPCNPNMYYDYHVHHRMIVKLQFMTRELMVDAYHKVNAVQIYRDQYYKSLQYQMGQMVYEMRNLYRKMIRIYQRVDSNYSYAYLDRHQNVNNYIKIQRLSMEIETKVVMILAWQRTRESKLQLHNRMKDPLRSGTNQEDGEEDEPVWEAQVRQRMARKAAAAGAKFEPARAPLAPARALRRPPILRNKKWRHQASRS